ncbi:hypothetical protein M440DRAFT_199209 [Trichoderma longibrachiatum ATCC 18648]|uniref:Uncharacterized protein n=1 Tax=Trichoderma longibrachiatum ATCC 18648 TaxID=983965 RepID=A0A2T4CGE7_TRILO|nr:hypothetical protein M440DRAFT_199209 [Trichoderma longibrachiatum ATCC 18648]
MLPMPWTPSALCWSPAETLPFCLFHLRRSLFHAFTGPSCSPRHVVTATTRALSAPCLSLIAAVCRALRRKPTDCVGAHN